MRRIAIVGALALLAVCGCKKGPSFAGAWVTDVPNFGTQTMHLNEDKTWNIDMSQKIQTFDIKATIKGTWSNTDKEMSLTTSDIQLSGLPPQLEALAKTQTGTYVWNGDDEFTFTVGGKSQTFKRSKS